jgi:hypothetical protein
VILVTNIQLAPKLIICEINPYLSNVELNSTALSLHQFQCPGQLYTLFCSVLCWFFVSFSHVVVAGRMVGL